MINNRSFPASPASAGAARRFVEDSVAHLSADQVDAVVLMVSELAANCIRFTMGEFNVGIEDVSSQTRVEVSDEGPGMPTMRSPRATDVSGRGLRIVQAMSDDWGVAAAGRPTGKTVWFVLEHRVVEAR